MLYNLIMVILFAGSLTAAYFCGRFFALREKSSRSPNAAPDEKALLEQRRAMQQYINFLSYNGEQQRKP